MDPYLAISISTGFECRVELMMDLDEYGDHGTVEEDGGWCDFRQLFERHFEGASTALRGDESFRALLGLPEAVVLSSWIKYGASIKVGNRYLEPIQWMWFLSYLRTSLSWVMLSLTWRVPIETYKRAVKCVLESLTDKMDEVC